MQYKYDDYDWCTEHEQLSDKEKQEILMQDYLEELVKHISDEKCA